MSNIQEREIERLELHIEELERQLAQARQELNDAAEVVGFYADPETWFAVALFSDPPSGDIMSDFSETKLGEKPGRRARDLLNKYAAIDAAIKGEPEQPPEPDQRP